jgi:hypothetical protein
MSRATVRTSSLLCFIGVLFFSLALLASSVAAQDRPAVFLHGFAAEPSDWASAAARLQQQTMIAPQLPALPWRSSYVDQVRSLQSNPAYAGLPSTTVAVGHSNGGIVAREWSRSHRLGGVITIGTPHRGAPIVPHFRDWVAFNSTTSTLLNIVISAFVRSTNWSWVSYVVDPLLHYTSFFSGWSVANLALVLGADAAMPVSIDAVPGSPYLVGLNSSNNLAREAAEVPNRVGIVSIAHNFYFAGPARAIAPDDADAVATTMYSAAASLLYWGNYILTQADPSNIDAMNQAFSLLNVSNYLLSVDPIYCRFVSRIDLSACLQNDGVVPDESQQYPNAPNILIGLSNDGPAHKQEKDRGVDALYDALVWYTHIPARSASPTPVPPPAPPPPPSDDGGSPPAAPTGPDILSPDEAMHPDDVVTSASGQYHLIYQLDGNLVLYNADWIPLWASGTDGTAPGVAVMQTDGNLVVYDASWTPIWASGTDGHPNAWLAVQSDGNVVIYDIAGPPLLHTDTVQ